MSENEPRESRRTSILKQIDLNPIIRGGFNDENDPTSTFTFSTAGFRRQSRRVSFAERTEIKEFRKHEAILSDLAAAEPAPQAGYRENLAIAEVSYQSSTDGMEVTYSADHHVTQHMNISSGSVVMEQTATMSISTVSRHQDMEITYVRDVTTRDPEPARDEQFGEMDLAGESPDKDGDCNMDITTVSGSGENHPSFNTEMDDVPGIEVNHVTFNADMDVGETILAPDATHFLLTKSMDHTGLQESLQLLTEASPHKEPLAVSFGAPDLSNATLHFLQEDSLHLSTVKPMEEFHLTFDETQNGGNVTMAKDLNQSMELPAELLLPSAPQQKLEPPPLPIPASETHLEPELPSAMEQVDVSEIANNSRNVQEQENIPDFAPLPVLENTHPEASLISNQKEAVQASMILDESVKTCDPVPDSTLQPVPETSVVDTLPEPAIQTPGPVPGSLADVPAVVEAPSMDFSIDATLANSSEMLQNPIGVPLPVPADLNPPDVPVSSLTVPESEPLPVAVPAPALPLPLPGATPDLLLDGLPFASDVNLSSIIAAPILDEPVAALSSDQSEIKTSEVEIVQMEEPAPVHVEPPADAVSKFLRTWKWGYPWKATKDDSRLSLMFSKGRFVVVVHLGDQFIRDNVLHRYIRDYTFETPGDHSDKPFLQLAHRLLQNTLIKNDLKRVCPSTEKLGELLQHLLANVHSLLVMECDVGRFLCRVLEEKVDLRTLTIHAEMSNHRSNVSVNVAITLRDTFPLKLRSIAFAPVIGTLKDVDQLVQMVKQIGPDRHYLAKVARCIDDYLEFKK